MKTYKLNNTEGPLEEQWVLIGDTEAGMALNEEIVDGTYCLQIEEFMSTKFLHIKKYKARYFSDPQEWGVVSVLELRGEVKKNGEKEIAVTSAARDLEQSQDYVYMQCMMLNILRGHMEVPGWQLK